MRQSGSDELAQILLLIRLELLDHVVRDAVFPLLQVRGEFQVLDGEVEQVCAVVDGYRDDGGVRFSEHG